MSDKEFLDEEGCLIILGLSLLLYIVGLMYMHQDGGGLRWWHFLAGLPLSVVASFLLIAGLFITQFVENLLAVLIVFAGLPALGVFLTVRMIQLNEHSWLAGAGAAYLFVGVLCRIQAIKHQSAEWGVNSTTSFVAGLVMISIGVTASLIG